ncbi:hypothetical protein F3J24_02060 [Comamonas sp. Tr-654]|uniref:retron Ec48 family effector membrane protein n=1 Tax=Comamonas sp. Tr-654 TaxID=2608341 RepID=UPI00142476ED|nr:retron Ec48 family effector membrane protein [Comamonas sp. Tr-654]NIF82297.1 hypothetical protein [Comamonas sp. Tr-654]
MSLKRFLDELGDYSTLFRWGCIIVFFPIAISFVALLIYFPYKQALSWDFCNNLSCVNKFFSDNFSSFSWFGYWLAVMYNLATIFGIFVAVLTYKKNSESQSMVNHFSNLSLFNNYVTNEIQKLDYLHLSSFDIVMWYRCIYDQSKNGSLECSDEYSSLIKDYSELINRSNLLKTSGPSSGYSYKKHQEEARNIVSKFGVNFEEASRTGFKEIEDQMLLLLEKVNMSFVCSSKLSSLPEASYK